MQKKSVISYFFIILNLFACHTIFADTFLFDSRYSTFKLNSGSIFAVDSPLSFYDGTLIREAGSTISGETITFDNGVFEDQGNQILMSAIFDPDGSLLLSGNQGIRASFGEILQAVTVSGINNLLQGSPRFADDITFQDMNTSLSVAVQSNVNKNIVLNGGTLILDDDLHFADDAIVTVSGNIQGNEFVLETGSLPFTWDANLLWQDGSHLWLRACKVDMPNVFTFRGNTSINGNGNVLDIRNGGSIVIDSNSILSLSDLVLKGLGAGGGNLVFNSDSSEVQMSNVTVEMVGSFTMSQGGILIKGPSTWIIKDNVWHFDNTASLTVDGIALYKEQAGADTIGDITFADPESHHLTLVNSGTIKAMNDNSIPVMIAMLKTSTGELQIMIDMLKVSTGENADMIAMLKTSTGDLQDMIDMLKISTGDNADMINMLKTSTGENADMIAMLKTSTGFLQEEIDNIVTATELGNLVQMVDMLKISTGENADMIAMLKTSTGDMQDMIDMLKISTGELQREIDNIMTSSLVVTSTCGIQISGCVNFDLTMLPDEGEVVVFNFDPCYAPKNNVPKLVFDPAIYGGGGVVSIPKDSRIVFSGHGIVQLEDGVIFDLLGTPGDPSMSDWPEIQLDTCAVMRPTENSTATVRGAGCFVLKKGASVTLDQDNSHFIFGENMMNDIVFKALFGSQLIVDNATALLTFHQGTFNLLFDNNSALSILDGTVEINTLQGVQSPGTINQWCFFGDSSLQILKKDDKLGTLRLAPNKLNSNVKFDNLIGEVFGDGNVQFVSFDGSGNELVNSILMLQDNTFNIDAPMVTVFMNMTYLLGDLIGQVSDATILVRFGWASGQEEGRLAAFCPSRDGSVVGLQEGDHDVRYDRSRIGGPIDLIRGFDIYNRRFTISNCDEKTRILCP